MQVAQLLEFTSDPDHLSEADVFVVTVPTPIDSAKRPDLTPLEKASVTVGVLSSNALGQYATRRLREHGLSGSHGRGVRPDSEQSGLAFNGGFYCGYSLSDQPGDNSFAHHNRQSDQRQHTAISNLGGWSLRLDYPTGTHLARA